MGWKERPTTPFRLGQVWGSSGGRSNVGLNSAYVNRTSGAAIGIRIQSDSADPINEVYILLDFTNGTRANVSMVANVYNLHTTVTQPGTTLLATSDVASLPASDDRWVRFVFSTPYTPAVGEWVFITIENTAAVPATDFPGIQITTSIASGIATRRLVPYSTTNGFSTAGTSQDELCVVIVQGSDVYGQACSLLSSIASFNGRRGILIGPDWKGFKTVRINLPGGSNNYSNFEIFELFEPPTGTPVVSTAISQLNGLTGSLYYDFDFSTLSGSGPWVLCANTSASLSIGGLGLIEGYSDYPAIFDALYDNFAFCPSVIQSGSTWVVDRSRAGGMTVELSALAATPPSSGGGLLSQGFIF